MFVKSVSFLSASIKSMIPMQKYPHIIELLAFMFLFRINSLISLGTCSTPKLTVIEQHVQHRNKQFHFSYKIKQSNVFQRLHIHQGLLCMSHPLFF